MKWTKAIQQELAVLKACPSKKEETSAVSRIQKAIWEKVRSQAGRHNIRRDLLSLIEFLGTSSTARGTTRRQLAHDIVQVLEPLAALEEKGDDYDFAQQEAYLIDRLTQRMVDKLQLLREFYPTDTVTETGVRKTFTPLPVRPNYLLTDAADMMIQHAVRTIIQRTMRDKYMAAVIYGSIPFPNAEAEGSSKAFDSIAEKFIPRFRKNAAEVDAAWRKVCQRYCEVDVFRVEGENNAEKAAIDIVRAMRTEAKIFGVHLPRQIDLGLIELFTRLSRPGLVESLKDVASATNHEDGDPYLRRMLERVCNRSMPLEGDLVMLAALHMPDCTKRLPVHAANGSCIGSCRSRSEMLSVRSVLASELQRLPGECIDLLSRHCAGDRLTIENLEMIIRLALDLVINLSRARFAPEMEPLERLLAHIDGSGKIANWLKDTRFQSDIDPMTDVLTEALTQMDGRHLAAA
ncbi:hypothetical protein EOI86_04685 [Hwanghaeella grinnelliae]|uniref:Uncharacterized protein n=1 Tax=Hwanghaeella grinnelliae TaxID=2500179 RepID=A0A3S2VRC2_9PROT|nr:hypothetical protein [Hwanghaeella grinnelliae]RVU38582.1 hypothetical protein EOI86_04685 [Hwanghaeella grinnelliae]